jgi:division protein CdvB (Snf7/Vps24/ESCRT-III family)
MEFTTRQEGAPAPHPEAIAKLRKQSAQLNQVSANLKERDRTLFDMCTRALERSDMLRAKIYANELSRVRQLKKVISQSQLVIDCVTIRFESFIELYNLFIELKPVSKVIQEISVDVRGVIPQFTAELEQLLSVTNETLLSSRLDLSQPSLEQALSASSQESQDILKEVSELVEGNIKSSFPEPPIKVTQRVVERPMEVFAYEPASRQAEAQRQPHGDGASRSEDWSVLSDDVVKMLDDLNARSRVRMEECVA